ncbi:hemicentin-2 isoform X1 [Nematostella vectensis]|nr:hemicentin-2 isoform X1 [Nematostella vectensis]
MITNVSRIDSGNYSCNASNELGIISAEAALDVQYGPEFVNMPQDKTPNEGWSVTFECHTKGNPPPTVTWLKNGSALNTSVDPRFYSNGTHLMITNVNRTDSGAYRCNASSILGVITTKASLDVYFKPAISIHPSPQTVTEGENVTLSCVAEGRPTPSYQWFKDDSPFDAEYNTRVSLSEGNLIFTKVSRDDRGQYYCLANNSVSNVTSSATQLTVFFAPSITTQPQNQTKVEGEIVTLNCTVTGDPVPTVYWSRDGSNLTALRYSVEPSNALRIDNLTREDEGSYICHAFNNVSSTSSDAAVLTVNYPPKFLESLKPEETRNETDNLTLTCKLEGKPQATVVWLKDNTELKPDIRLIITQPSLVDSGESTLTIINLDRSDEASYKCRANNTVGIVTSSNTTVTVQYPPKFFKIPDDVTKTEGSSVNLTCQLECKPKCSVTWLKGGSPLDTSSDRISVTQPENDGNGTSFLMISNLNRTDEASYSCRAKNAAGEKTSGSVNLAVNYPPKFLESLKDEETRNETDNLTLTCKLEGKPLATVVWLRNNTELKPDSKLIITQPSSVDSGDSTLTIINVNRHDEAYYKCRANNTVDTTISSTNTSVVVQYPPKFFQSPKDETVTEKSNVTLTCQLECKPKCSVTWLKDNTPLDTSPDRITVTHPGSYGNTTSSLTITNLVRTDEARYSCKAINAVGEKTSEQGLLTVNYPPKILTPPKNVTITEGNDVTLSCKVEGKPEVTVDWLNGSTPIELSSVIEKTGLAVTGIGLSNLTIKGVSRYYEGSYKCRAKRDPDTSESDPAYITVNYPPKFLEILKAEETRNETDNLTLTCKLEGKPLATVLWLKDNTELEPDSRLIITQPSSVDSGESTLTIINVNRHDEAYYQCRANNTVDTTTSTTNTSVVVQYPPKFFQSPKNETVTEKSNVTLTCQLECKPKCSVTWLKDNTPLDTSPDRITVTHPGSYGNTTSSLTITNLVRTDEARYSCKAINAAGEKSSEQGLLTVNYPPKFLESLKPEETRNETDNLTLTCKLEGKPLATVVWLKDNTELKPDSRLIITQPSLVESGESTLKIINVNRHDEAYYKCRANNTVDTTTSNSTSVVVQYPPKFFQSPKNETVTEKSNVTLTCQLECKPKCSVTWLKDNTPLDTSPDRITVTHPGSYGNTTSSLTITNLVRTDEARYSCKAINAAGEKSSEQGLLTVNYPPKFLESLKPEETRNETDNLTLTCKLEGKPLATVVWLKDNTELKPDSRLIITQPSLVESGESTLKIINVNRHDEAYYKCRANNTVDTTTSNSTSVVVQYPPKFFQSPKNETVTEKSNVTLTCQLECKPKCSVTWLKDNTPLDTSPDRITVTHPGSYGNTTSSLTITNLVRTDEARYSCKAINAAGEKSSEQGLLTVNYPPKILSSPKSITKIEGNEVTLSCKVEGKPAVTVAWFNGSSEMTSSGNIEISGTSVPGVWFSNLTIKGVSRYDEGNYKCEASNGANTSVSDVAKLTVNFPPRIFKTSANQTREEGQQITFTCDVEGKEGTSPPNVYWKKDGADVTADGNRTTAQSPTNYLGPSTASLTIKNVQREDEGFYQCFAENSLKTVYSTPSIHLTVHFNSTIFECSGAQNVTERQNDDVIIWCEVEGKPKPEVSWHVRGRGQQVEPNARITIEQPANTSRQKVRLVIKQVERGDTGMYYIKIGARSYEPRLLNVQYPAENINLKVSDDGKVDVGKQISLVCEADGNPIPTFSWLKDDENFRIDIVATKSDDKRNMTLREVQRFYGGNYTCVARNGIGQEQKKTVTVAVEDPEGPSVAKQQKESSHNYITIPVFDYEYAGNGKKICFFIIIKVAGPSRSYPREEEVGKDPYLITGVYKRVSGKKEFKVGNEQYETFDTAECSRGRRRRSLPKVVKADNKPLDANTKYSFLQQAYDDNGNLLESYVWITRETDHNVGLIVGVLIAVIAILLILGAVVFFLWRRQKNKEDNPADADMQLQHRSRSRIGTIVGRLSHKSGRELSAYDNYIPGQVIPVDEFEEHVRRLHANGELLFSQEYGAFRSPDTVTSHHSLNQANRFKNRYNNITAFDHCRVLLQPIEGDPTSDYINANYLDGYRKQREYIAAQGPLPETCHDFWRMVWEQNSRVIVMVTNCEERGRIKCHQYWPSSGSQNYGVIHVNMMSTVELSDYTIRSFGVKRSGSPEERMVLQYHYTAWPDHGVPSSVTSVLNFVRKSSAVNLTEDYGPMVVHCSAGVGRTGTYVVIDAQLKRIQAEATVDVYNYVMMLRGQRNLMVQVEDQYVLIHDVLLEAIACGDTEIQARDLRQRIKELMRPSTDTGQTEMDAEFQRLSRNKAPPSKFQSANLPVNKHKNRYANVLPYDDTRVRLTMQAVTEGSDYINANYIDGYMSKKAFIATQAPIPDTIPDFWRMIWEQDCCTIVMLSQEMESGKVKVHRYWPGKQPTSIGNLVVEMLHDKQFDDYIMREFKVTNTKESASRVVRQYQFTAWPDIGSPDSGGGLIDLIGQVQRWQQKCGVQLTAVHCSAGVGRTGVFCAVSILIERLKAEAMVDVFQTVKQLREQRPAMVQTKEQYEFCYQTLGEYLHSFDPYNNFD